MIEIINFQDRYLFTSQYITYQSIGAVSKCFVENCAANQRANTFAGSYIAGGSQQKQNSSYILKKIYGKFQAKTNPKSS